MEDLTIGREIDGYRITEVLGRGGMGVVYKAKEVAPARHVALKRIDPAFARDRSFRRRFRSEARAFIDKQRAAQLPDAFALEPNYPNPFGHETTITYTVPRDAQAVDVEVDIYNVLGQVVQRFVQAEKGPGRYFLRWDGRDTHGTPLASGVYFVRFVADGRVVGSHKMVLVR